MSFEFVTAPPPKGWFSFDPAFQVRMASSHYPNAFVRFVQRWLLGIYWTKA